MDHTQSIADFFSLSPVLLGWLKPYLGTLTYDLSPGRMVESVILLAIIWRKLKPYLEKMETRLAGVENAVTKGFNSGETRFQKIEERVTAIENITKGDPDENNSEPHSTSGR